MIVLHRLSKNSAADILGTKGYVLLTDASMTALELDGEALGMRAHAERYDDVGEIACRLEDLRQRWQAESDRRQVFVERDGASFERTVTVPVERTVAWEWLTAPERRVLYAADDVVSMTPGGRQRSGVTNHCMHGPDVIVEHIADWRPFDYFTKSYDFPGVGRMSWTFEFVEDGGRTSSPCEASRSTARDRPPGPRSAATCSQGSTTARRPSSTKWTASRGRPRPASAGGPFAGA